MNSTKWDELDKIRWNRLNQMKSTKSDELNSIRWTRQNQMNWQLNWVFWDPLLDCWWLWKFGWGKCTLHCSLTRWTQLNQMNWRLNWVNSTKSTHPSPPAWLLVMIVQNYCASVPLSFADKVHCSFNQRKLCWWNFKTWSMAKLKVTAIKIEIWVIANLIHLKQKQWWMRNIVKIFKMWRNRIRLTGRSPYRTLSIILGITKLQYDKWQRWFWSWSKCAACRDRCAT